MKKKKKMVWMVILSLILFLNLLMHFVSSCNITLNYLSTALAAFVFSNTRRRGIIWKEKKIKG